MKKTFVCKATCYDGKTTRAHPVSVQAIGDALILEGAGIRVGFRREGIRVAPRLDRTVGILYFQGGQKCEFKDNDALDEIAKCLSLSQRMRWVHRLESNGWMVAFALLLLIPTVIAAYQFGIPAAANYVGDKIPQSIAQSIGTDLLPLLDELQFKPSEVSESKQAQMRKAFAPMAEQYPTLGLNLNFRKMGRQTRWRFPTVRSSSPTNLWSWLNVTKNFRPSWRTKLATLKIVIH